MEEKDKSRKRFGYLRKQNAPDAMSECSVKSGAVVKMFISEPEKANQQVSGK